MKLKNYTLEKYGGYAKRSFHRFIGLKSLVVLCLFLHLSMGMASAQNVTITPGDNPSVVPMGDSLVFTLELYASADISGGVLEVEVPAGYEMLASTPGFIAGSLSSNKLKGKVSLPLQASTAKSWNVHVKALCNAETAAIENDRKVTYKYYPNASATTPLVTKQIENAIKNFYNPILNISYPVAELVPIGETRKRTFKVEQTREFSHINNLKVTATVNRSGFLISGVEVSRDSLTWTSLPAANFVETSSGYEYTLTRQDCFGPLGYSGKQLGYANAVYIRETVSLLMCDSGRVSYSFRYGDGTSFCDPIASAAVTWTQPDLSHTADIFELQYVRPKSPTINGYHRVGFTNNSISSDAILYNIYVHQYSGSSAYYKAWLCNSAGALIAGPGGATDTIFLTLSASGAVNTQIRFDNLNDPAYASAYASAGLSSLDGDGIYNDIEKGKTVYYVVTMNYSLTNSQVCGQGNLYGTGNRYANLYAQTFCKQGYTSYKRNYSAAGSTDQWEGRFQLSVLKDVTVTPSPNLRANNTEAQLNFFPSNNDGNCSYSVMCGDKAGVLTNLATGANSYTKTSEMWMTVILPKGLSFLATPSAVPALRAGGSLNTTTNMWSTGGTVINAADYEVKLASSGATTGDTIRIHITAANYNSMLTSQLHIPVICNGEIDNTKQVSSYIEYVYGETGSYESVSAPKRRVGCPTAAVPYVELLPCSNVELLSFDVERQSFGYTNKAMTTKVTSVAQAKALNFNLKVLTPYDNVDLIGETQVNTSMFLAGNDIWVEAFWSDTQKSMDTIAGLPGAISLYYNSVATPIEIPANNIQYTYVSGIQKFRFNIAPALRSTLSTLNAGDKIIIVMHLRGTTAMPISIKRIYPTMQISTTINNIAETCSPIMADVQIFNNNYGNQTACSGGVTACHPVYFEHNASTWVAAMNNTINWSYGAPLATWTGGEFRPNRGEYSNIIIQYPMLVRINKVRMRSSTNGTGNIVDAKVLDSTGLFAGTAPYFVEYANGRTILTIRDTVTKSYMGTSSATGIGYDVQLDVINPGANASTNAIMPIRNTYSFVNYPTSEWPNMPNFSRTNVSNLSVTSNPNGYVGAYPYRYSISPVPAHVSPLGARVEWTLRLNNLSRWAATDRDLPNSWIAVECPTGVLPVELRDATTNTPIAASFVEYATNKYWIKIGDITTNASATKDFVLSCTYTVCAGTPRLTVKYGMSKVDYPTDPDQGYANYNSSGVLAGVVNTSLTFTPPVAKFAGRLQHYANEAMNTNRFCDTLTFEAYYSNALATEIGNLQLRINITELSGYNFYSSYTPEVKFGNGGWVPAQSATVSNGILLITLDDSRTLSAYGAANNADKAWLKFKMRMTCGVENGMQVPAELLGSSGCGAETVETVASVQPVRIFGLTPPPDYWINDLSLIQSAMTGAVNEDGKMRLIGKYVQAEGASTGVQAIIDLPDNLILEEINMPSINFTSTSKGRRLVADLPSTTPIGTEFPFDMTLTPTDPALWSMDTFYVYIRTGKINEMSCDGLNCQVLELGARQDSVMLSMDKLQVRLSENITAKSRYGDATSERVEIEGWIVNEGDIDAGRLTMDLLYFNGAYYEAVSNVVSGLTVNAVPKNDSVKFKVVANVHYQQDICNMMLVLRKFNSSAGSLNPYLADSSSVIVPVPEYKLSAQTDPICQLSGNTLIGELPITEYQYVWEPSDYLSRSNVTQTYFTYDYENKPVANDTVLKYAISIIRPNQCISVDTLEVPLKGIPYVQDFEDMTLCSGESLYIEFKDTTNTLGTTTFSWVIENGPSVGLSASGTRAIISLSSVRNNTTQPIVLQVRVTPKKNNCEGVTKNFFITVNPTPQINYIAEQPPYCNGTMVAPQTLSGNLSSSLYRWEKIGGDNIGGLTEGINIIPTFMASNATTSTITGNFRAYAEYENADKKCYSDTLNFSIKIDPSPIVNTVGDKHVCNGGNLNISFTGTSVGTYYWQKVSGSNIPGLNSNGTGNISISSISNTSTNPISAVYKVTPSTTSGTCMGSEDNFTITIYPTPALTSEKTPEAICSGSTFNYTATSTTRNLVYSWKRLPNSDIAGTASTGNNEVISEVLTNTTQTPTTVKYEYTLTQEIYCPKKDTISVAVNPVTDLILTNTQLSVCSGTTTSLNLGYTTTNTISNLQYKIAYSDAALGVGFTNVNYTSLPTGNKIPVALPSNTAPGVYNGTVTVRFSGAQACTKDYSFTITVNAMPNLTTEKDNNIICSGEEFSIALTSDINDVTYSWTRVTNASINGGAGKTGTGQNLKETLISTATTPVIAKYGVTVKTPYCSVSDTIKVTVNPKPTLNNMPVSPVICSGTAFQYTPISNVSSTTITWERLDATGIDEPGKTGTGAINETLTNNSTSSIVVTYELTLRANGCENKQLLRVTVSPSPVLTTTLYPEAICSGSSFNYTARSATRNVDFSWTRQSLPSGVTGTTASGITERITDLLTNTGNAPATVKYNVKLTLGSCSNTETVEVIVNPVPKLNSSLNAGTLCSGEYFVYDITSLTQGSSFTWRRQSNSNINEVITNSGSALISERLTVKEGVSTQQTVTYQIFTEANGCRNAGETVTLKVNPLPTVSVDMSPVSLAALGNTTVNATTNGEVVSWTSSNTNVVTVSPIGANQLSAKFEGKNAGTAYVTLEVRNATTLCTNKLSIMVNVGSQNTAGMTLASGYPSLICNGEGTDLNIDISGGEAPFIAVYTTSINGTPTGVNTTVGNLQASSRISVSPSNSTNAISTIVYSLVSVTDNAGQNITVLPSSISVMVNPTPTISNTNLNNQTVCEASMLTIPNFSSLVANATFEWQNDNPAINLGMSGTGNIPMFQVKNGQGTSISAGITVTPIVKSGNLTCTGISKGFTITVNPQPTFTVVNPSAICEGESYTFSSSDITSLIPVTSTVKFYSDRTCATEVTTVSPTQTTIYFVKATSAAPATCASEVREIILNVNPKPVLNSALTATVCSGERFEYTASSSISNVSFAWQRAAVTGITNIAGNGNGALIRETLVNETNTSKEVIYRIAMSANGCVDTQEVKLTVYPKPELTSSLTPTGICSGEEFNNTLTFNIVLGSYSWSRQYINGIEENEGSGNNAPIVETLTNNGVSPITVRYNVVMESTQGCSNIQDIKVEVSPKPALSSTLYPNSICSGSTFNYTARSRTSDVTYSWKRIANVDITPAPTGSTAGSTVTETLTNNSTSPVTVEYEITMELSNGCKNTEIVELVVNPTPKVSSSLTNDTICSGDYFAYTIESATTGVSYIWKRARVTGISQTQGFGTVPYINEVLTNTTSSRVEVEYDITIEANGCSMTGIKKKVIVNPSPTITITNASPIVMNIGGTETIEAVTSGGTLTWTSSVPSVIEIVSTSGNEAEIKAKAQGTAVIMVSVENSDGCISQASIIVNVGAAPTAVISLTAGAPSEICNLSSSMLDVTITGGVAPFKIYYTDGTTSRMATAYTSPYTLTVTPPENTGNAQVSVTYKLDSVTYGSSNTRIQSSGEVAIKVNPTAKITSSLSDITVCQGVTVPALSFTSNVDVARVSYEWTNDNPNIGLAISGQNGVPSFLAENKVGTATQATIAVTPKYNGTISCAGETKSYIITVDPKPTFSVVKPNAICDGTSYTFGAADVSGIQPAGSTASFYNDRACTQLISTAVSPSQTTTYYVRAVSLDGCLSDVLEITLEVNPRPSLNSPLATSICSGERLEYTASSSLSGVSYSWERAAILNISNVAGSGNGASIRETLIDTVNTPVDVTYKIAMLANGCRDTQDVIVTVYPKPVLTSTLNPTGICSGATFDYTPTVNVSGSSYNWTRVYVNGIEETEISGNNVKIQEVLTNSSTAPITVRYNISLESPNGCVNTQDVRVEVSPKPMLSSSLAPNPICSGGTFTYTARSRTTGVDFSWKRLPNANITPAPAASASGNIITEVLTNTSTSPVTVEYEITMELSNGCKNTEIVELTVNPSPKVSSDLTDDAICSGDYFTYNIESGTPGVNYIWKRARVTGISQTQGFGTVPYINEVLTNTTTNSIDVIYEISVEANGCTSSGFTKKITVNPTPTVNITNASPILMNVGGTENITLNTTATVIDWNSSVPSVIEITNPGGMGSAQIEAKAQGTSVVTVTVQNATGCISQASIIVNVGAAPTAVLSLSAGAAGEVCNHGSTILDVTISGGTAPFKIYYTDGVTQQVATAYTSPYSVMVVPPVNTGDAQTNVTYKLDSVVYGASNTHIQSSGEVVIKVNPTAEITTTLSDIVVCQGSTVPAQLFASNILDASKVSYEWSNDNPNIGLSISGQNGVPSFQADNKVGMRTFANITVTPKYLSGALNCTGTSKTYKITVDPKPVFTVITPAPICEEGDYTFSTSNDISGLQPSTSTVTFYSDRACTAPVTIVSPTITTTYYVRAQSDVGCLSDVQEIVLGVNQKPILNSQLTPSVCSGERFEYTATSQLSGVAYAWSRATVLGIDNSAGSGNGAVIRETLVNSTNAPINVIYVITLTSNGCPYTQNVTVKVNPKPYLTSSQTPTGICSGASFDYTPTINVASTNYSWNRLYANGIDEPETNGNGPISEILTNSSTATITVRYNVAMETSQGCTNTQDVKVEVSPTPQLSSNLYPNAICSGTDFNYTARSRTSDVNFSWKRLTTIGITGSVVGGEGTGPIIAEKLDNTTTAPIIVEYEFTLKLSNGCENKQIIEVVINPAPKMSSSALDEEICSGDIFSYLITSETPGASVIWQRAKVTGISQTQGFGAVPYINEVLINTTNAPVDVTYEITIEANGCTTTGIIKKVTVNPIPEVKINEASPVMMNVGGTQILTANTSETNLAWISGNPSAVDIISTSTNQATIKADGRGTATVTVTATNTYGCSSPASVVVNVEAAPTAVLALASGSASEVCNGGQTMLEVTITGGTAPFEIIYTDGVTSGLTTTAYTSPHRFTVALPSNTTNAAKDFTYELEDITYGIANTSIECSGKAIIIVNPTAEISTSLPDLNVCQGDIVPFQAFTSNVDASKISYEWVNDNPNIGLSMSGQGLIPSFQADNKIGASTSANITVTPKYNGVQICTGISKTYKITVNPKPVFTVIKPSAICDGTPITLTENDVTGLRPLGSSVKFYEDQICTQEVVTVTPSYTRVYYVQATSPAPENCLSDVQEITVTVNPNPELNSPLTATICSGERFEYTSASNLPNVSYSWTRVHVTDISNPASSGNGGVIRETLVNIGDAPVIVTYEITMTSMGCISTQNVLVTVNPKPVLNNIPSDLNVCSGSNFTYLPTSNVASTNIYWERVSNSNILEVSNSGNGQIDERLTNLTPNPVTVTYQFALSSNGCENPQTIHVIVNPIPALSSLYDGGSICSGATFNYTAQTQTQNTTFSWVRLANADITPAPSSPVSSQFISEQLTNTSNSRVIVNYDITLTANNCSKTERVTVVVNPAPMITISNDTVICEGETALMQFELRGTSPWTVYYNNGVGNHKSIEVNTATYIEPLTLINDTIINFVELVDGSGCRTQLSRTYQVIVNPIPQIANLTDFVYCAGDQTIDYDFMSSNVSVNTTHEWQLVSGNNCGLPSGNGMDRIPAFQASNGGHEPEYSVYHLISTYTEHGVSCSSEPQSFTITVNPIPVLSSSIDGGAICSGESFIYEANSLTSGTTYEWQQVAHGDVNNGKIAKGIGREIQQVLSNTSDNAVSVSYHVSLTANGCSAAQPEIVTVNINPAPYLNIAPLTHVCTGETEALVGFTAIRNIPMNYNLSFSSNAQNAGFVDITSLDTLMGSQLSVVVPQSAYRGVYTATMLVRSGTCDSTYSFDIRLSAPVHITEQPEAPESLCNGTSVLELNVKAEGDELAYQWYHDGNLIGGAQDSLYRSAYTNEMNGEYHVVVRSICGSTKTSDIIRVDSNSFGIERKWDDILYVYNEGVAAVSYQWYKNGKAISRDGKEQYYVDPKGVNGKYYAQITFIDGSIKETCPIIFGDLDIASISLDNSISIYPNPVKKDGTVMIEIKAESKLKSINNIEIFDVSGKRVYKSEVKRDIIEIPVQFSSGTYVVRLSDSKGNIAVQKLIVK